MKRKKQSGIEKGIQNSLLELLPDYLECLDTEIDQAEGDDAEAFVDRRRTAIADVDQILLQLKGKTLKLI